MSEKQQSSVPDLGFFSFFPFFFFFFLFLLKNFLGTANEIWVRSVD